MIVTEISACADLLPSGKIALPPGVHLLGQEVDCGVQILDPSVSRHHARLTIDGDGAMLLEDLDSTNGSFIDGHRIDQPASVAANQTITLGTADLLVQQRRADEPVDFDLPVQSPRPVTTSEPASSELPLEIAGTSRYQIERHIAQGGMGAVMGARQPAIRREVAMKVMLKGADPLSRMRFIEEAQITGQLEHPNIVPVHDLALDEHGQPYYTMKLVKGTNLNEVIEAIREGKPEALARYPLPVLLTVFQKVCDAIAFAHSHGVIHRDLKPANIMIGDFGEVLVMDWGLAKLIQRTEPEPPLKLVSGPVSANTSSTVTSSRAEQSDTFATLDGYIVGTPQFMSPEQINGDPNGLDGRSDVFALGAILYTLLTLHPPFTGKNVQEVIEHIESGQFTRRKALDSTKLRHLPGSRVPDSLKAVVRMALSTQVEQRYQSVPALQADLAAYQGGFATSAENAGAWRQFKLLVQRHKAAAAGIAAVFVIGITLGTQALLAGRRAELALTELKKSAPAFAAEADSLLLKGDVDGALARLDTARQLDAGAPRWPARRGQILDAALRFPEAATAYGQAAALDPGGAWSAARQHSEKIAAARQPDGSYSPALLQELYAQAIRENRTGDALLLATPLKLAAGEALPLWQAKVDAWLGKDAPRIKLERDGGYALNVDRLGITDLTPLRGMPLKWLGLAYNKVSDLSPLAGMPLRGISIDRTEVSDLSPLVDMRLTSISMAEAPVSDLSPLRGMPLNSFLAQTQTLTDISALSESPLTNVVRLEGSRVSDLAPLAGKKITYLQLPNTSLKNLSALRGMPLKQLHLSSGSYTEELVEIVMSLSQLEMLTITSSVPGFERLRTHPTLKLIGHDSNQRDRYLAVADYWLAYEHRRSEAAKYAAHKVNVTIRPDGTKRLSFEDPGLTAIPSLDWTNVSQLNLIGTAVSDLSPVRGVKLRGIALQRSRVTDLSPLRGSSIEKIAFMDTGVTDVSPLLDCPNLEQVALSRRVKNVEVLRQHPKLRYIGYTEGPPPGYLPEATVEEFWKAWDARKAGGTQ